LIGSFLMWPSNCFSRFPTVDFMSFAASGACLPAFSAEPSEDSNLSIQTEHTATFQKITAGESDVARFDDVETGKNLEGSGCGSMSPTIMRENSGQRVKANESWKMRANG
jgi:hypothetical protein